MVAASRQQQLEQQAKKAAATGTGAPERVSRAACRGPLRGTWACSHCTKKTHALVAQQHALCHAGLPRRQAYCRFHLGVQDNSRGAAAAGSCIRHPEAQR